MLRRWAAPMGTSSTKPLATPLDARFQHVRVRSLTFGLDGDLDACGERFLRELRLTESAVPLGAA